MRWLDSTADSMDMNLSKLWEIVEDCSLACYSPWGCKESDTAQQLNNSNNKIDRIPGMGSFLSSLFCSIDLCVLLPVSYYIYYYSFVIQFEIRACDLGHLALFYFLKIVLAIQHLLWFHTHFRIGTLLGIALNLKIVLVSMDIFTILIFLIHEHGVSFHVYVSSSISFPSILQFSVYRCFTSLVKIIPTYFILFAIIINRIIFLNFSFCLFVISVWKCNLFLCVDFVSCNFTAFVISSNGFWLWWFFCLLFVLGEDFGGVFRVSYIQYYVTWKQ